MSLSVFEMHSVQLSCQRPLGTCYVVCDERHYKACLGKAADLQKAKAETQEFLSIAELNQRKWEEDSTLVRRLIDRDLLAFQGVRDWNPDTDGWWIIKALLNDVGKGARLAIKGPRADLFPLRHSMPLRNLAARAVDLPDGKPMLSSQYDPATRQTRLAVARAAMTGGTSDGGALLDAAAAVIGAPPGDGNASTVLDNAQPFHYQPDSADGDTFDVAGIPNMTGDPNSWIESGPGMKKQWRMFDSNGSVAVDIDFDSHHGQPNRHAHNWDGNVRDQGWPVSILPWRGKP